MESNNIYRGTLFIDMHGVLVQSDKMIKNYENILINLYSKYKISKEQAIDYHYSGLRLYQDLMSEIKEKIITNGQFLLEMDRADKRWDKMMQDFVPYTNPSEIESRNVEYLAGCYSDTFYEDGKFFLNEIVKNGQIDYFIISNSHSKHIEGLLQGANIKSIPIQKLLGWDKVKALKNDKLYYTTLAKFVSKKSSLKIIIGNSKDEMVFGKEAGFKTIFVRREFKKEFDFKDHCDIIVNDLHSILPFIYQFLEN